MQSLSAAAGKPAAIHALVTLGVTDGRLDNTSWLSGKPSGVTISAMTTCRQSPRLSRL